MIVTEIFYGLKCNRCMEMYDDGEHSFWNDEGAAVENAMESEWVEEKGKHYCPDCHEVDEETDEVKVKLDFPKHLIALKKFIDNVCRSHSSQVSEHDDWFKISTSLFTNEIRLSPFEEDYIKGSLGDNLISIEYKKHERFSSHYCLIKIKK